MLFKKYGEIIKLTATQWFENKVSRLGAALSYYTIFSLGPLLIISIAIAGFVLEKKHVQQNFLNSMNELVGTYGVHQIQNMINISVNFSSSYYEACLGIIILLVGATGFFSQLEDSLNTVWGVETKSGRGIIGIIRDRFFAFTMIIGLALLLFISTIYSILLNFFVTHFGQSFLNHNILQIFNHCISLGIITVIFAAIFKIIPDVILKWRDVWLGSFLTAVMFTIGKFALAWYFAHANLHSTYGAASSLIILIIWINYSAQILLLGAQFIKIHVTATNFQPIKVAENAVAINITKHEDQVIT